MATGLSCCFPVVLAVPLNPLAESLVDSKPPEITFEELTERVDLVGCDVFNGWILFDNKEWRFGWEEDTEERREDFVAAPTVEKGDDKCKDF